LTNPGAYATRTQWLGQVMMSLLLTGNAYGLVSSRDSFANPLQISSRTNNQRKIMG
jgi:phage portal protein BeeE